MRDRPHFVTDEHLAYLDALRESGKTNMYGAGRWVERRFRVTRDRAGEIVRYWMRTFSERHPEGA